MSFVTISNTERDSRGATTLPNQPTISATALKQEFDAPAKEIVVPKFNQLVSELEATTAAASLGATAPIGRTGTTVQGVINELANELDNNALDIANLQVEAHSHPNKEYIDKITEDSNGKPLYDGNVIGETDYEALDNQPQINGHTLSGNMSTSDIGITIPDELSDLADDADHRLVTDSEKSAWNGKLNNAFANVKVGAHIISASGGDEFELEAGNNVTMSVSGKKVKISATGGGGGGGGDMYSSDYAKLGVTDTVDNAVSLYDGTDSLSATIPELNKAADIKQTYIGTGTGSDSPISGAGVYDALSGMDIDVSSVQDGDLLTAETVGGVTKWKNKQVDKSLVRYGGSCTFAQLSTVAPLTAASVDKFFLVTDSFTTTSDFIVGAGVEMDANSHIAIIEYSAGVYKYDDFGGYVDISGKADKADDMWVATASVASGEVAFTGIDDTSVCAYIVFFNVPDGNPPIEYYAKLKFLSGSGTSSMSATYKTDAPNGTAAKLRRIK